MSFLASIYIIQGSWSKSCARTWDYQSDDTIFLRPSPVSRVTTGSVDESGGPVQLLRPDESWLVGGMVERLHSSTRLRQAGPAFPHNLHFYNTAPTPTGQTPMASSNGRFKETFQSFGSSLCLCYFVSPPARNGFCLKCGTECVEKSTSWKDARKHPHSHTTPILTRHQVDHFQEIWHFVRLYFT